jgi:hypothetical protein
MISSPASGRAVAIASPRAAGDGTTGRLLVVFGAAIVTACFHSAQIWPAALPPGKQITAKFTVPRAVDVGGDSTLVVQELSGRVVALRADTLVVRLNKVPEQPERQRWLGRDARFTLDSTTTVSANGFDRGSAGLIVIAGIAFVYGFIGSLPP